MYLRESLKKTFADVTGVGKLPARAVREAVRSRKAHAIVFKDDGVIPNNPRLPFVLYRTPVRLTDTAAAATLLEQLFARNGWTDAWRDGIYDYVHYHPRTHEVLGVARGHARVRFGGGKGRVIELNPGDVAVLPAGTGHESLLASRDLLVVGAYPRTGKYDEYEGTPEEYRRALKSISAVPLPAKDPVYGPDGPLMDLWSA